MVSLSFVDNGLETGGTATISGAFVGATVSVYVSRFSGRSEGRSFTVAGTRTGDGNVSLTLSPGPYMMVAVCSDGQMSVPQVFRVKQLTESIHYRCAVALREFVLNLAPSGFPSDPDRHIVAKLSAKLKQAMEETDSCVIYTFNAESIQPMDNRRDMFKLPIAMIYTRKSGQTIFDGIKDVLRAREQVHRAISDVFLPDVPEVFGVEFAPGMPIDPQRWLQNFDASGMTFSFMASVNAGII